MKCCRVRLALMLGAMVVVNGGVVASDEEPAELVHTFAERMFAHIKARALECPEPSADNIAEICAAFDRGFSSFKFQWDSGIRVDFDDDVKPMGSWKRKREGYIRDYALGELSLTVRFVDREGRVELVLRRRPEPVEDDGADDPEGDPVDLPGAGA